MIKSVYLRMWFDTLDTNEKESINRGIKEKLHAVVYESVWSLLFISLYTLIQLDDVAAYEPHQVGEVGHGCFVSDVVQHVLVIHCRA